MAPANLLSLTPSLTFDFFFIGNFSLKKLTRTSGAFPALELLMASSAMAEDSNGKNSLRLAILLKDSKFAIWDWTEETLVLTSSNYLSSKRAYPTGLSNKMYMTIWLSLLNELIIIITYPIDLWLFFTHLINYYILYLMKWTIFGAIYHSLFHYIQTTFYSQNLLINISKWIIPTKMQYHMSKIMMMWSRKFNHWINFYKNLPIKTHCNKLLIKLVHKTIWIYSVHFYIYFSIFDL